MSHLIKELEVGQGLIGFNIERRFGYFSKLHKTVLQMKQSCLCIRNESSLSK